MTATTGSEDQPDENARAVGVVAFDRYQLIEQFAAPSGSQFWRAYDIRLRRTVSVDLIEPDAIGTSGADAVRQFSQDTSGTGDGQETHVARVYDILTAASGDASTESEVDSRVAVVAEWVPGRTLAELALTRPDQKDAVRAVRALAANTAASHRHGHHLPLDHPGRVRVDEDARLVLAYPSTPATATEQADVAGLGAILYALLTGLWPLGAADCTYGGLPSAPRRGGEVLSPREVLSSVDPRLSSLTMKILALGGTELSAEELVEALDDWSAHIVAGTVNDPQAARQARAARLPERRRERTSSGPIGALVLGAALVLALGIAGWGVGTWSTSSVSRSMTDVQSIPAPTSGAVPQSDAFVPTGATTTGLGPSGFTTVSAGEVIDGLAATSWTSALSAQQFPSDDLTLTVTFPVLAEVGDVWIDSLTPGAIVEIRTVPDASGSLDTTRLLGTGTITSGITRISLSAAEPSDRIMLRFTGLAPISSGFQVSVADIGFTGRR